MKAFHVSVTMAFSERVFAMNNGVKLAEYFTGKTVYRTHHFLIGSVDTPHEAIQKALQCKQLYEEPDSIVYDAVAVEESNFDFIIP